MKVQEIADFYHSRREEREHLTFRERPLATFVALIKGLSRHVPGYAKEVLLHPFTCLVVLPVTVAWFFQEWYPHPYREEVNKIEFWVEYVVWWVGLGILSSIGMGTGLQSGVLFLFPHIVKVCLAAQTCDTVTFESYADMWFRTDDALFRCPPPATPDDLQQPASFFGMWSKIVLPCFLQAVGTAIGEIPPYIMARAARLAALEASNIHSDSSGPLVLPTSPLGNGRREERSGEGDGKQDRLSSSLFSSPSSSSASDMPADATSNGGLRTRSLSTESLDSLPDELNQHTEDELQGGMRGLSAWLLNTFKRWMLGFLHQYGFYGVLALSSWPNIAFDLCGICCGHYLMPFWHFFIATLIGKAIIRNSYQSVLYVTFCSEAYLEGMIRGLQYMSPDVLAIDTTIRSKLEALRASFTNPIPNPSSISSTQDGAREASGWAGIELDAKALWTMLMCGMLVLFVSSCLEQAAQYYQYLEDVELTKSCISILSPSDQRSIHSPSGRLKLPQPSRGIDTSCSKDLLENFSSLSPGLATCGDGEREREREEVGVGEQGTDESEDFGRRTTPRARRRGK